MLVFLLLICTGCVEGFTPIDYSENDDIKSGPGLFSGEEGEFVIHQADPLRRNLKD